MEEFRYTYTRLCKDNHIDPQECVLSFLKRYCFVKSLSLQQCLDNFICILNKCDLLFLFSKSLILPFIPPPLFSSFHSYCQVFFMPDISLSIYFQSYNSFPPVSIVHIVYSCMYNFPVAPWGPLIGQ